MKKCDLFKIKKEDCPIFVSATDLRGFLGWGIRFRTNGIVSHSMIINRPGFFVTQGVTYKEIPFEKYLRRGVMLRLWKCEDITKEERDEIYYGITFDLHLPWWERMYDAPGIIGQLVGLRWINVPQLNYCSERVAKRVRVIIPDLKKHPTPSEIDNALKASKRFVELGYYMCEKGE